MPNAAAAKTLTLEVEQKGSQAVVHCHGRLVSDSGNGLFLKVRELLPVNKCIVIDLTDVAFVDSMGLGTLVRIYASCKSNGATSSTCQSRQADSGDARRHQLDVNLL